MYSSDEFSVKRPGEKAIAFDPDTGRVFFSDFPALQSANNNGLHASDIIDPANNQDLARVIGMALSRVGRFVESQCHFRNRMSLVRVLAEEFSPDSGPTSTGMLKDVAWTRRVQVFIKHE